MGKIFGPVVQDIASGADKTVTAIPLAGHPATVYSEAFELKYGQSFGVFCKASGASPRFDVAFEESYKEPAAANVNAADGDYAVPTGMSNVHDSIADTSAHIAALTPVVAKWGRFKITSDASNGAGTTISLKLMKIEEA